MSGTPNFDKNAMTALALYVYKQITEYIAN